MDDQTTVSVGTPGHMTEPIPFDTFKRRTEGLAGVDTETGEVLGRGIQPTLDDENYETQIRAVCAIHKWRSLPGYRHLWYWLVSSW